MNKSLLRFLAIFGCGMLATTSCSKSHLSLNIVDNFDKARYLGKWFEIARMDVRFERGLSNTTANYSINPDGSVKVTNRGYNSLKNKWSEAVGKAYFVDLETRGKLKVSFFGPFYGEYNIIKLDSAYQYVLVAGDSPSYLWILSRTPNLPESVRNEYLECAEKAGFDTTKLIWVQHTQK